MVKRWHLIVLSLIFAGQGFGFESRPWVTLEIFSHQVTREIIFTTQAPAKEKIASKRITWLAPGRLSLDGEVFDREISLEGPAWFESGKVSRLSEDSSRISAGRLGLVVVVKLKPASYLAGVLCAESAPWAGLSPRAAKNYLKAQAIASRSYALFYLLAGRHPNADFCDSTHCQAWRYSENPLYEEAVIATSRQILSLNGEPAPCFYSSTAGPSTLLPSEVWGSSQLDHFFSRVPTRNLQQTSPHSSWSYKLSKVVLDQILENDFGMIRDLGPVRLERGSAGNVRRIHLGRDSLPAEEFRLAVCRATSWGSLRSLWFELDETKSDLIFNGQGLGHGVGLCQYGALELARQGQSYQEILRFYYPKLELKVIYSH